MVAAEDARLKADSERDASRQALVDAEEACRKAEEENGHLDSCHGRCTGINNIYKPKIPPTAVAKLLQYSGSRVEHRDGFSSYK